MNKLYKDIIHLDVITCLIIVTLVILSKVMDCIVDLLIIAQGR